MLCSTPPSSTVSRYLSNGRSSRVDARSSKLCVFVGRTVSENVCVLLHRTPKTLILPSTASNSSSLSPWRSAYPARCRPNIIPVPLENTATKKKNRSLPPRNIGIVISTDAMLFPPKTACDMPSARGPMIADTISSSIFESVAKKKKNCSMDSKTFIDSMEEQVSLADTVVLSAGMLGFGFACIWSLYLVRASRWATRDSRLAREVRTPPRGCLHMRMHFLVQDPAQSAALASAVGTLPPRAKILAVKQTPSSDAFLRVLEMEQTPVLAVGPGGVVFRISHRLPLQTEYASLYAKEKWEDIVEEVRSIDRKVKDSMGATAPMTVVLYAVPDVHGLVDTVSFPFPVETDSVFGTLQTDERIALLCLHTDNAFEDHCRR